MISCADTLMGKRMRASGSLRWLMVPALLAILPVLMKLPLILGILKPDVLLLFSGLAVGLQPGLPGTLPPLPTIDPCMGYTAQTLGYRAALDLISGRMPWWNPFAGVGAPLAGDMQSASFLPLTLLLLLPNGQLYEQIILQIIAGFGTYLLLRTLVVPRSIAFAGAAAYQVNGVFAWFGFAAFNVAAFFPFLLLGIERAYALALEQRRGGATLVALALAASLYAGFPEVAYFGGLMAGAWSLTRLCMLPGRARYIFIMKIVAGGFAGLLLAAPILIAFADYLQVADVGGHQGGAFLGIHMDPGYVPLVLFPYLYGGIFQAPEHSGFWSTVGGYSGAVLAILGIAGLFGRRNLPLRLVLGAWVLVALGVTFGASWTKWVYIIPGFPDAALYRYLDATWIMALCILSAFALDDLLAAGRRWQFTGPLLGVTIVLGATLLAPNFVPSPVLHGTFARLSAAATFAILAAVTACLAVSQLTVRQRAAGLATLLVLEAVLWFALPVICYPRTGEAELAGIRFLQTNLGMQRFATVGPIGPNYGSYFGIASVNHNNIPVPRAWSKYLVRLDSNSPSVVFNGLNRANPDGPSGAQELMHNQTAFAAVGVRYVTAPLGQPLPGLREVFRDRVQIIYELDHPAPYFSAAGCRLDIQGRTHVIADCNASTTLSRLEMAMPGWRAWVNGQLTPITTAQEIFQSLALQPGHSEVMFVFEPPFMTLGYLCVVVGAAILIAMRLPRCGPARRATPRQAHVVH